MEVLELKTRGISRILVFFFFIFGLWWPKKRLATLYQVFGLIFQTVFSFLYTMFMLINLVMLTDMNKLANSMYMPLTELALFFKIANFFYRNRLMQGLLQTVNEFVLESDDEIELVKRKITGFFRVLIYYFICVNWAGLNADVSALAAKDPQLPFPAWYPVDWSHNRRDYWIAFTYQAIGMIISSNLNITIELFPIFMLFIISVKIDILGMRLQKLGLMQNKAMASVASKPNKDEDHSLSLLKDAIKTHQDISM